MNNNSIKKNKRRQGVKGFDLGIDFKETPDTLAENFISKLQSMGFVSINKLYLENYINADISIAFSHIKSHHKNYVGKNSWSEDKFFDVILVAIRRRMMLTTNTFLKLGLQYDEGKLTQDVRVERQKYNQEFQSKQTDNKIEDIPEGMTQDDYDEIMAHLIKNGG